MAVEFHIVWIRGRKNPGLKICGDRFAEILELVKAHNRTYGMSYDSRMKLWVANALSLHNFVHKYLTPYGRDQASWERLKKEMADARVMQQDAGNHLPLTGLAFDRECLMAEPIQGKPGHRDFQVDAIQQALKYPRFGLFLDMGLGKTFIMIGVLNHLLKHRGLKRILIVAPSEGVYTWVHELRRFLMEPWASQLDTIVTIGSKDNRRPFHQDMISEGPRIVICTYRTFVLLCDDYCKIKRRGRATRAAVLGPWLKDWGGGADPETSAIVLDESHNIKNPSARQASLIEAHSDFFNYRYLLSGTPAPNGAHEFYMQMRMLSEALVPKTYSAFLTEIAEVGTKHSATAIARYLPDGVRRYDSVFKTISLRLKTSDVLHLPPLVIENVYVQLSEKQRRIYEGMVSSTLFSLKAKYGKVEPRRVRQAFPYMSMALDNPCLLQGRVADFSSGATQLDQWRFSDHAKIAVCAELLKRYIVDEGRKVILFDFHPMTLESLAEYFQQYHPLIVHGTSGGQDKAGYRDNIRQLFQDPSSPHKLLVGSLEVLTTSITLTAATVVIYFSRTYSLMKYLQSMKRAHRIGTKEPVIVHPLIFEDSLNVHQEANLRFKKAFDENVFKLDTLSDQQWREIFDGRGIKMQSATIDDLGYDLNEEALVMAEELNDEAEAQFMAPERWRL